MADDAAAERWNHASRPSWGVRHSSTGVRTLVGARVEATMHVEHPDRTACDLDQRALAGADLVTMPTTYLARADLPFSSPPLGGGAALSAARCRRSVPTLSLWSLHIVKNEMEAGFRLTEFGVGPGGRLDVEGSAAYFHFGEPKFRLVE